jgi:chromosome segregation ATPase
MNEQILTLRDELEAASQQIELVRDQSSRTETGCHQLIDGLITGNEQLQTEIAHQKEDIRTLTSELKDQAQVRLRCMFECRDEYTTPLNYTHPDPLPGAIVHREARQILCLFYNGRLARMTFMLLSGTMSSLLPDRQWALFIRARPFRESLDSLLQLTRITASEKTETSSR